MREGSKLEEYKLSAWGTVELSDLADALQTP